MTAAYVYAAVRTPFGKLGGGLAQIRPDDLAATVLTGLLAKTPGLDQGAIDEVVWGNANGAGEENRNVGRMAVLLAGLPTSVPATTVNRLCGVSLDAAMIASRTIETGDADVAVAGGVESMTRAPWVLLKPARPFPPGNLEAVSTTLGWRLVNERMPAEWTVSLGEGNEQLREKYGISRERQDAFAARSHQLADAAWAAGFYDDLVMPVPGAELVRDETIRSGSTPEALAALKPVFRPDGTITAGNASPLNDGASAILLGAETAADRIGSSPVARIAGRGAYALDPPMFDMRRGGGRAGAPQSRHRLGRCWCRRAERGLRRAVPRLHRRLGNRSRDRQHTRWRNRHRSSAGGLRRPHFGTLTKVLQERRERWGVAAICIGVGQALAVVVENTSGELS